MLINPPASSHRKRQKARPPVTPRVAALTLVSASFESFNAILSFDRAIDVTSFNPAAIYVNDADRSMQLQGGGDYGLQDANTISMSMSEIGDYEGSQSSLTAGADSGIVAVDDRGAWAGVTELGLPYP